MTAEPSRFSLLASFFLGSLALYCLTLAPTFSWGDSADLALRMLYDGEHLFEGGRRDYVFYRAVGYILQLIPYGDAGTRANLMSAFFGSVTVMAVGAMVYDITRNAWASTAAACALMVSHTFWLLSVIAEVYTFNAALAFGAFAFVSYWWHSQRQWALLPAALCTALALLHHATGLVLAACIAPLILWHLKRIHPLLLIACAAILFGITHSYWIGTYERLSNGDNLLYSLGLSVSQNAFYESQPLKELVKFVAYLGYNFIGIGFLLGAAGAIYAWCNRCWAFLPACIWFIAFVYAGTGSSIPDKFNIYILIYPSFAVAVGLGMHWLLSLKPITHRWRMLIMAAILLTPPATYYAAVMASQRFDIDLVGARQAPYRDNAYYFLFPPKNGDDGPRRYAEEALKDAAPNAVMITDYTLWRPLSFVRNLEHQRDDVELVFVEWLLKDGVTRYIESISCEKPVFLATNTPARYYQLEEVEKHFEVLKSGIIYQVVRSCSGDS